MKLLQQKCVIFLLQKIKFFTENKSISDAIPTTLETKTDFPES